MLDGFNHVAILTPDLDRLEAFYRDVFGRRRGASDGVRGPAPHPRPESARRRCCTRSSRTRRRRHRIFERGRLDHLALNVADHDEFERLRQRLVDAGASTGEVTDFGALLSITFEDPDGHVCELCWMRPTATLADAVDPW